MGVLTDRVAVVTGGGSGIGRAIARAYAAEGARLVVADYFLDRAVETARLCGDDDRAVAERADVSAAEDVDRVVGATVRRFGRLDVLVNNAGIYDGYADCLSTSEALWDRVLDVNLKGAFLCCRRALAEMLPAGRGVIVNIASVGGLLASADGTSYTASKFGLVGLTRQIAVTYASRGITCNAICPGVVRTAIRDSSARILGEAAPPMGGGVGASDDWLRRVVPMGRAGLPEEVGGLAVVLASPVSAYVTGQAIAVDGGWSAR